MNAYDLFYRWEMLANFQTIDYILFIVRRFITLWAFGSGIRLVRYTVCLPVTYTGNGLIVVMNTAYQCIVGGVEHSGTESACA